MQRGPLNIGAPQCCRIAPLTIWRGSSCDLHRFSKSYPENGDGRGDSRRTSSHFAMSYTAREREWISVYVRQLHANVWIKRQFFSLRGNGNRSYREDTVPIQGGRSASQGAGGPRSCNGA